MKRVFENVGLNYKVQDRYNLLVDGEGISYEAANGKGSLDLKFSDVGSIFLTGYCNSNRNYTVTFRNPDGKDIGEIYTDVPAGREHNVLETKSVLIAFAESKLTKAFPDNIDDLDLKIAFSLTEKEIRLKEAAIIGEKHTVKLSDIRRVKCVTNGVLSNLSVYTREKGGFFDKADMNVPVNELTLPILEAVMARNTGRGIDFSRGNGWDQKTSEYILIRYMNASFFANDDGSITDDWHRIAYDHIQFYNSDVTIPESLGEAA